MASTPVCPWCPKRASPLPISSMTNAVPAELCFGLGAPCSRCSSPPRLSSGPGCSFGLMPGVFDALILLDAFFSCLVSGACPWCFCGRGQVVKCRLGSHIDAIRQGLLAVLQPLVSRMASKHVLHTRDAGSLKAWTVLQVGLV